MERILGIMSDVVANFLFAKLEYYEWIFFLVQKPCWLPVNYLCCRNPLLPEV